MTFGAPLSAIVAWPSPVLRAAAADVTVFDAHLAGELDRMAAIVRDRRAYGLAGPQVGILRRVLVWRAQPDGPVAELVNPRIDWVSDRTEAGEEGCLSLPGLLLEVDRPVAVRVSGADRRGRPVYVSAERQAARVLCHEIDHLNGRLIIDRVSKERRRTALRALAEQAG